MSKCSDSDIGAGHSRDIDAGHSRDSGGGRPGTPVKTSRTFIFSFQRVYLNADIATRSGKEDIWKKRKKMI